MTIQVSDIKLLASERLTDTDDGGGRMTGSVIESGVLNNLFPDISRLDRTYGRLGLRKAYMAVQSQDTDTYLGAHAILTDPPNDPKVSVAMFTTGSVTDERSDAQDRIESYLTVGPLSPYFLYGTQPAGAKAISLMGRVESPLPDVGDVLVLSVETNGVASVQQYVRIADIKTETRDFTDSQGDYTRKVVTLTLTSKLRQNYVGSEATRLSVVNSPTVVRTTTVADASSYYGVNPLAVPAAANALEVTVQSIYTQLVPATTRETAVAGATPGLALSYIAASVAQALNAGPSPVYQYRGVLPGSVTASVSQGSATDVGGNLVVNNVAVGTVDYDAGRLASTFVNGGTYVPAAPASTAAHTFGVDITLANQGTVYVLTLPTVPAPGTLVVSFRYLGKWYALTDSAGDGTVGGGSTNLGGGTIDYTSGAITLTLGAIPDIGSKLLYAWGDPTSYAQHAGDLTVDTPTVTFQVAQYPIKPGSLSISWLSGGVTKTATVAADGTISGNATGTVVYLSGMIILTPAAGAFPDSNTKFDVTYLQADGNQGAVTGAYAAGQITFDLPAAAVPLKPGTVSGSIAGFYGGTSYTLYYKDDGAGNIVTATELAPKTQGLKYNNQQIPELYLPIISVNAGTIDYGTGHVVIQPGSVAARDYIIKQVEPNKPKYAWGAWKLQQGEATFLPNPIVQYRGQATTTGEVQQEESVAFPGITFVLTRTVVDPILPGSVWFEWGGKTYVDRQGKIVRDMSVSNGSATEAGSIDYQTGVVTLANYGSSTGGAVSIKALVTRFGPMPVSYAAFRTPGAPIRPASLYVQARRVDTGETITATSTAGGAITGTYVGGTVNADQGWVEVTFGEYVPAAGNETQPWYSADNVVGSNVWRPLLVDPTSITFNCVVQSTLPLSEEVLGIDPVRLPLTGKVPIYRDGDVVVIHERAARSWPASVTAGQVVTLSGGPFGQIDLLDANGDDVDVAYYTADLEAGTVTMASSLSGLAQPLTASVTLEDMVLVSNVDLSGLLTLAAPLSRDYSTAALVSSALLFGDLQAQNPVFFSQQTWQGAWADGINGSPTTAQYNRTLYPLQIVNANATTERWALIFTSNAGGNIVGETLGQIGAFAIADDTAPTNPLTGQPYFVLKKEGWGSGWGVGNVLRFNTIGPNAPIWFARTVLPGAQATVGDSFRLQMRGDAQ